MENDYLLDRDVQRTTTYTGIWGVNDQDRAIQESMGPLYDRRKEHLGTSDLAIMTARKRLLNLARELQQGIEPFPASHGDIYRVRAMDVNTPVDDFDATIQTATRGGSKADQGDHSRAPVGTGSHVCNRRNIQNA